MPKCIMLAHFTHTARRGDLCQTTQATYGALSNCADHAYRDHAARGPMTLRGSHDGGHGIVRICVTDDGRWIDPAILVISRSRRVILMRALADDFTIDGRDDGTTVCLHLHDCPDASLDGYGGDTP